MILSSAANCKLSQLHKDKSNSLESSEVEIGTMGNEDPHPVLCACLYCFLFPFRFSSILDTAKPSRQLCAVQPGQVQPSSLIPDRTSQWNSRQFRKRFNSRFRWRWRMDIAEQEEPMVQREISLHRLRNCRMERKATCLVRER